MKIRLSFFIPVIAAGVVGGFIGGVVARAGCAGSCAGAGVFFIGLASGLTAAIGVGVVTALAHRSLAEWRQTKYGEAGEHEE